MLWKLRQAFAIQVAAQSNKADHRQRLTRALEFLSVVSLAPSPGVLSIFPVCQMGHTGITQNTSITNSSSPGLAGGSKGMLSKRSPLSRRTRSSGAVEHEVALLVLPVDVHVRSAPLGSVQGIDYHSGNDKSVHLADDDLPPGPLDRECVPQDVAQLLGTAVAPPTPGALFDVMFLCVDLETRIERVAWRVEPAGVEVGADIALGIGAVTNKRIEHRPVRTLDASATDDVASVREEVRRALVELQAADQEEKDALRTQLNKLEAQEERLIELAADGTIAVEKLRQRLEYGTLQKGAITEKLTRTVERIPHGVDKAFAFVDLLEDPAALYRQLPDNVRRELLTAFFTRLDVQVTDREVSIGVERTELNAGLHDWRAQNRLSASAHTPTKEKRASRASAEDSLSDLYPLTQSKGLNKPVLVGMTGFEPATP
jgi:hypothetical protein